MHVGQLIQYAMQFVGIPYKWGGNNPVEGFDCSGLVLELLVASGKWPHGKDANCQMIWEHFKANKVPGARPSAGDLVFFGKSVKAITHIGFCINDQYMIEAGGGDSTTTSNEVAAKRNAFVRIRPIKYRKDLLDVLFV